MLCGIPAANPQASRRDSATISLSPCSKPLRQFCTMSYTFCRMSVLRIAPLTEVAVIRRLARKRLRYTAVFAAHLPLDPPVAATAGRHTCVHLQPEEPGDPVGLVAAPGEDPSTAELWGLQVSIFHSLRLGAGCHARRSVQLLVPGGPVTWSHSDISTDTQSSFS